MGIEEAYRQMVAHGFNVNALMLYAMEGALSDTHWNDSPDERKAELRRISARIKKQHKLTK